MNLIWLETEVTYSKESKGRKAFIQSVSESLQELEIIKATDKVCGNSVSVAFGGGLRQWPLQSSECNSCCRDFSTPIIPSLTQNVNQEI